MSRTAAAAAVFADFPVASAAGRRPDRGAAHPQAPLRREWAVVCDARARPASSPAGSGPGRPTSPRPTAGSRPWSADPMIVRRAARVGVALAEAGGPEAAGLSQR